MKLLRLLLALVALGCMSCSEASGPSHVPTQADQSFGSGGLTLVDVGGAGHEDEPFTLIKAQDGALVAPGKAFNEGNGTFDIAVLRFRADGSVDESFGQDGVALIEFGHYEEGQGVVELPDRRLVVGGFSKRADDTSDFVLARLRADGSLDKSFGHEGRVITDLGQNDQMLALVLQSDGKLVAGGLTFAPGEQSRSDFALVRYEPDGSLDTSFGTGGIVTTDFSGGSEFIFRMLVQSDGKIVAVGSTEDPLNGDSDFAVARYHSDGALDRSFGGEPAPGLAATDFFGENDRAFSVLDLPDGKLLVSGLAAGSADLHSSDMALVRYNRDGSIDSSFAVDGQPGMITVDIFGGYDQIMSLAVQPDGKILAAGHARHPVRNFEFAFVRFDPDGAMDSSFGLRGIYTIDAFGGADGLHGLVLQPDGKAVAVGDVDNPSTGGDDFALTKLLIADIDWVDAVVEQLPDQMFVGAEARGTLRAQLRAADDELRSGEAASATHTLTELLSYLDGCGSEPDTGDWVTGCAAQEQLRSLISQIVFKVSGSYPSDLHR